jgi:hypothetical protein
MYVTQWFNVVFRGTHNQELIEFYKKNGNFKGRKSTTYDILDNSLLSRIIAFVNNTDGDISVNFIVIDKIVSYVFVTYWRSSVCTVGQYINIYRP